MINDINYFYKENKYITKIINSYFENIEIILNANNLRSSILLIGSLSRGEGTWKFIDNHYKVYSDVEFWIIYENEIDKTILDNELGIIKSKIFNNTDWPLFHIDYSYVRLDNLKKMERRFLVFEAKQLGKTIIGEDYRNVLPEINIKNIYIDDIRDIIFHRLFSYFHYSANSNISDDDERYIIAKNSLDLITYFLVKNNYLVAGLSQRLSIFMQNYNDFESYYNYCYAIKRGEDNSKTFTLDEMKMIFISLIKHYYHQKLKQKKILLNLWFLLRRKAGIFKRIITSKKICFVSKKKHFKNMILYLETPSDKLKEKIYLHQYFLFGFKK